MSLQWEHTAKCHALVSPLQDQKIHISMETCHLYKIDNVCKTFLSGGSLIFNLHIQSLKLADVKYLRQKAYGVKLKGPNL